MQAQEFTTDELILFEDMFDRTPAWTQWQQHSGRSGTTVIVVRVEARRPFIMKLAKTGDGKYAAIGFDGWALTVCDRFADLLGIVAPKPAAPALAA